MIILPVDKLYPTDSDHEEQIYALFKENNEARARKERAKDFDERYNELKQKEYNQYQEYAHEARIRIGEEELRNWYLDKDRED